MTFMAFQAQPTRYGQLSRIAHLRHGVCLALIDGRAVYLYAARTGEERYGTIREAHRKR